MDSFLDGIKVIFLDPAVIGAILTMLNTIIVINKSNNTLLTHNESKGYNRKKQIGGESMPAEYLTETELCEWLKVSRSSVLRWRAEGMPFIKFARSVRYEREKVEAWISTRTTTEGRVR